jgi:hypothetical protein
MWTDDEDDEDDDLEGFDRETDVFARPSVTPAVERAPGQTPQSQTGNATLREAERRLIEEASERLQALEARIAGEWDALKQQHDEHLRDLRARVEALTHSGEQTARSAQHAVDQVQARLLLLEEGVGRNLAAAARDLASGARLLRSQAAPGAEAAAAPAPPRFSWWTVAAVFAAALAAVMAGYASLRVAGLAGRAENAERQAAAALELAKREAALRQDSDRMAAEALSRSIDGQRLALILAAPDRRIAALQGGTAVPSASGQVWWSPTRGIVLSATGIPPPARGRTFQAWVVTNAGATSLGTLARDDSGRLDGTFAPPSRFGSPARFLVTSEPEGGSSTPGRPVVLESANP